jgi:hypothetical protein
MKAGWLGAVELLVAEAVVGWYTCTDTGLFGKVAEAVVSHTYMDPGLAQVLRSLVDHKAADQVRVGMVLHTAAEQVRPDMVEHKAAEQVRVGMVLHTAAEEVRPDMVEHKAAEQVGQLGQVAEAVVGHTYMEAWLAQGLHSLAMEHKAVEQVGVGMVLDKAAEEQL